MIGLGCMRLSTIEPRDPSHGIAVIHAALSAGATLLDTADAYCLDDRDTGHNERLVAQALKTWSGDAGSIAVATKDRKSTRLNSSHQIISYAVFCLKKNK